MDPTSWSAYSQHFSRLGASMNHPSSALTPQAQMNDLALSSSLPRQEHIPGYGNAGGPHPFLLAASHGLNPSQANHNDPSFNANLFANYDASLFSSSFPPGNKGHLSSFPQGGLFKAVNRENDFNDLRTGFAHCGMAAYSRNSDGSNALPGSAGHLFPNSMPPGSWRHSGMIPSNCGPFGVLPHETVLQRSHLVGRGSEKLSGPKQSRGSIPNSSFVEQDLSRGYRSILSSPARPPSSYVEGSNTSHSTLLSPQNDPYFSSVSDNYYSSCSKNDFAAYSSYCSNMPPSVQRGSISPYCYSQTFGNFDSMDKSDQINRPEATNASTKPSANSNFTNFVPNNSLNGSNPSQVHNGQISRQSVITSNVSNNSSTYNSESHPNHSYNLREAYPYPPVPPPNDSRERNRQSMAHSNNNHSSASQNLYPPMNTPIPASTPAHTTPPSSSMGQAYVPTPLPLSHDSGCSSVNSQSVMYHSPSNDGCYSTHSESGSPAKQDLSSPSVYSIESSNLSVNSGPFTDNHHGRADGNYGNGPSEIVDNSGRNSAKAIDNCRSSRKDAHLTPLDMVKMNKESYQGDVNYTNRRPVQTQAHAKNHSEGAIKRKNDFPFSPNSSPSVLDFASKDKAKLDRKCKTDVSTNSLPLNCTYSHLQNRQSQLSSPESAGDAEDNKNDSTSIQSNESLSLDEEMPVTSSPLPVDLSQVTSMNLTSKKSDSPVGDTKDHLPDLNYETDKSGGKWSLTKQELSKEGGGDDEKSAVNSMSEKDKDEPLIRTPPPLDELSDESKKLCNSIEDLGFLAGLSSDPDVEDSASKGSFSDKKGKREKGLLQSFLTFLESSNDPPVPTDPINLESKPDQKEDVVNSPKSEEIVRKEDDEIPNDNSKLAENKTLIEEHDDKDNFDEAPSLDPTLFGCSSLQKEMVVPNPEAPSFSSDEDENSTQDIFDSVAMAIQRLCEDNEEDHTDKNKSSCKGNAKKEISGQSSSEPTHNVEQTTDNNVTVKEETPEQCSIKSARVVKKRGKRRKASHLLVIKVKRNAEKPPTDVKSSKTISNAKTRNASKVKQNSQCSPRRVLMRKCKEKDLKNKRAGSKRRKTRNCVKRKYVFEEPEENSTTVDVKDDSPKVVEIDDIDEDKEIIPLKKCSKTSSAASSSNMENEEIIISDLSADDSLETKENKESHNMDIQEIPILDSSGPPPAKVPAKERLSTEKSPGSAAARKKRIQRNPYRTRKRRRKSTKKTSEIPVVEIPKIIEPEITNTSSSEANDTHLKENAITSNENCSNVETHFKTGDYVISIETKESSYPPIWRIEGKNVLQLFETIQKEGCNSVFYKNTSSYSRWSPSSKHKYLLQPVSVIESNDETVIVELLKSNENNTVDEIDISGTCDYALHPNKESFEIYLQILVSHALDVEFIPAIVKDNDEYFLSHYQKIEEITSQKKLCIYNEKWGSQLFHSMEMYPYITTTLKKEEETDSCPVCNINKIQYIAHFHGSIYDALTLESKSEESNLMSDSHCVGPVYKQSLSTVVCITIDTTSIYQVVKR